MSRVKYFMPIRDENEFKVINIILKRNATTGALSVEEYGDLGSKEKKKCHTFRMRTK